MKDQEKEIREKFWKCLYTSGEKEMFHYWLLLPQNVKPAELKPVTFQEVGLTNIDDTSPMTPAPILKSGLRMNTASGR